MMANSFPGVFAGKMTFYSTQPGGPNFYLSTCRVSDGNHGWNFWPGMNATTAGETEKFLLYLYADTYYRLQSGDLRWLTYNEGGGYIEYGDDPMLAAPFVLQGTPFGSTWLLHTTNGDQQLSYLCQSNVSIPNTLSLNGSEGDLSTFVPAIITPSLAVIRQQKHAKNADFNNAILVGQDLSQGIDFTGASFMQTQLAGVNFSAATLDQVNMSQTDLRGLNWGSPASAVSINLSGSNASGCILGGQKAQLNCTNALLSAGTFVNTNLVNLNLQGAQLGSANLNSVILDSANLTKATLNGVVAIKGSFIGAILTDASAQMGIFIQAIFDQATLTRVKMGASSFLFVLNNNFTTELDTVKFPQQDLLTAFQTNGITLNPAAAIEILSSGTRWQLDDPAGPYKLFLTDTGIQVFNGNPSLVPAVLQGASFIGTQAPTASLSGADLRGVRWFGSPSTLNHADLEDAALSGAVLISMDFTQANLSGADFSGSLLMQAKFIGCVAGPGGNQRAISFEGAHLEGADFSKSTFASAILTNAAVAISGGVPLLFLTLADQQYLTTAGISNLTTAFQTAGFNLGDSPTVSDNSSWNITSQTKQYVVQPGAGNLQVFSAGVFLFTIPSTMSAYLNQPTASQPLVSTFTAKGYPLTLGSPITVQKSWAIVPDDSVTYLKPYRFPKMVVQPEATRLIVYGIAPIMIDNLSDYPAGVAFSGTQNLEDALNPTAIGPAGVPFGWIAQEWVDEEAFYVALN